MGTFARIIRSQVTLFVAAVMLLPTQVLADFDLLLPMSESGGGSYTIPGRFGDAPRTPFLVDTGAAITTISSRLFRKLERSRDLKPVRRVAARMANGKLEVVKIYRIENFMLGERCALGAIDVAVMSNDGRNILGMNTLAKAAPFGLHLAPPALAVSQCERPAPGTNLALAH